MGRWRDDDGSLSSTLDVTDEFLTTRLVSVTASPSWRPIRRPVPRCEYCGRLKERGEVQCPGCGVMR